MSADLEERFRPAPEDESAIVEACERLLPVIREAARACGYAVGVHGSMRRDLDLIAAPWIACASDAETLARAIRDAIAEKVGPAYWRVHETPGPHGRRWANIHLSSEGGVRTRAGIFPFIDLSIMPTTAAG